MATLRTDELNIFSSDERKRSIPYRQYFGEMYLEPEEKEKRIKMANDLDDVFLFLFAMIYSFGGVGEGLSYSVLYEMGERRYKDAIEPYIAMSFSENPDLENYIARQVRYIVDTTVENVGDPYYTSEDRAMFVAENQVNGVANEIQQEKALAAGLTHKRWVSMRDLHVRETHKVADGQVVAIMQPFTVGSSLLNYPCDDSLGAGAEEIVNCRCVVEYTNAPEEKKVSKTARMDLQFFAEKALAKQSVAQLKKGIASLQNRVSEHLEHINNPQNYVDGWDNLDENMRKGLVRHWEKEIQTFQTGIQDRTNELSSRGETIE